MTRYEVACKLDVSFYIDLEDGVEVEKTIMEEAPKRWMYLGEDYIGECGDVFGLEDVEITRGGFQPDEDD